MKNNPLLQTTNRYWIKMKMSVYFPFSANNNLKTLITIGYVLAGVVGAIFFLLILICIIQRIANHKHKQLYDDHNLANAARERMLQHREVERDEQPPARTVLPGPIVEYRPPEYSEQGDGTVSFPGEKKKMAFHRPGSGGDDGASCSAAVVESPSGDGPTSLGSLEERIPMLQPPPFDDSLSTPAQPGGATSLPLRPISQPPSYEEVLREDAKLPSIS